MNNIGLEQAAALVTDDNLKFPVQETEQDFRPEQESGRLHDDYEKSLLHYSRYSVRRVSGSSTLLLSASSEGHSWSTEEDRSSPRSSLNISDCEAQLYLNPQYSSDNLEYSFVAGMEKQLLATRRSRTSSLGSNPFVLGSTESRGDEVFVEEVSSQPKLIRRELKEYPVGTGDTCGLKTRYIATLPDSIFNSTFIIYGHDDQLGIPGYVERHRLVDDPAHYKIALEMFLIELDVMSRMNHFNIVTFLGGHSYESCDGLHLVLRQTYAGKPVKEVYCPEGKKETRGERMTQRLLLTQFLGFWKAVSHMREQRVLHRDICPDNLMCRDDQLILIDFDQAADCRNGFPRDFSGRQFYAAPETQLLKTQDYTADVFSTAVTCLKLLEWQGYIAPESMKRVGIERKERVRGKLIKLIFNGIKPVLKHPVPLKIEQLFECLVRCVDVNPTLRPSAESVVAELTQLIPLSISYTPDVSSDEEDEDSLTVGKDLETSSQKSV
ncbi:protein kinase domain-containing protein [Endozoicomonas numazuensis]|nr:protein kinase [Endozoicomonas numazuensis]